VLITDARHKPTDLHLQRIKYLGAKAKPFIIAATKADKLGGNQLKASLTRASEASDSDDIIAYSAVTRRGADRIWNRVTSQIADFQ